jgi:hypothetical protein
MINAADLPAVRAAQEDNVQRLAEAAAEAAPAACAVACYPAKKLVLDGGRYVVAEPTK